MLCDGQTFASAFLPSFRANHTLLSPNKSQTSLILPCLYLSANCSLTFQLKPLPLWPVALNFVTTLRTSDLPQDLFLISTSFPFAVWKLSTIWPTWLNTALQFAVIHTNIHLLRAYNPHVWSTTADHHLCLPYTSLLPSSTQYFSNTSSSTDLQNTLRWLFVSVCMRFLHIPHTSSVYSFFFVKIKNLLQPVRETASTSDFLLSRTSLLAAPSSPGKLPNWLLVPSVTPWHNLSLPPTFVKHQRSHLKCHVYKIEIHISEHLVVFRAWRLPSCGNSSSGTHRSLLNPERKNDQRALGGILRNGFGPNVASRKNFCCSRTDSVAVQFPGRIIHKINAVEKPKNRIVLMCVYLRTGITTQNVLLRHVIHLHMRVVNDRIASCHCHKASRTAYRNNKMQRKCRTLNTKR